ncbi:50S ribosomal protein L22 [Candidatus Dojkabacteria bacterium]|jgi:large subunit ribosomal protein L22|nr:50S ribosomal protein L22 [Candidatus Dojkabacteria bacterium]
MEQVEDLNNMDKTIKVTIKNVSVSPVKVRLVANLIRRMDIEKAVDVLAFLNKKAAIHIRKALMSGIASAKSILGVELKDLKIASISVDEGQNGKGVRFESRGRVSRLVKRKSHINLEISKK